LSGTNNRPSLFGLPQTPGFGIQGTKSTNRVSQLASVACAGLGLPLFPKITLLMKTLRWLLVAAMTVLLVQVGSACIEELDLAEMISKTDSAVQGTITDVRTVRFVPEGDDRLIYTILTIEGEDLYTGQAVTVESAFLGGTFEDDSMMVTSMPAPSEYRLGNNVVVFRGAVEGWGPEIDHAVYAAMGGIYRTVDTKKGLVVLGKGEGFAVESNTRVSALKVQMANLQEVQR
jgi:hypothetical protein